MDSGPFQTQSIFACASIFSSFFNGSLSDIWIYLFGIGFKLFEKSWIRIHLDIRNKYFLSLPSDHRINVFKRFTILFHQICYYNRYTSANSCIAVYQNIGLFSRTLDKLIGPVKMHRYVIVLMILSLKVKIIRNLFGRMG